MPRRKPMSQVQRKAIGAGVRRYHARARACLAKQATPKPKRRIAPTKVSASCYRKTMLKTAPKKSAAARRRITPTCQIDHK